MVGAGAAGASPPASTVAFGDAGLCTSTGVCLIGPGQTFAGLVNGARGQAVIRTGCFGPIHPYQLGHPIAGQTVAVSRLVASTARGIGFTGEASSIAAYADFPDPRASAIRPRIAEFKSYNQPAKISTDLLLPCDGTGEITFEPVDGGLTARPARVKVSFVSIGDAPASAG